PRPVAGCVQTQASPAAVGRSSDRFEFQLFDSDATLQVESDRAAMSLHEESGTQITVEPNQITGVLVAELTSRGRSRFAATAQIPRTWIVDSVETQPPEMLADRSLAASGPGPHLLQLKLARPVTPQRPLRLIVRAHYRRPANNQPLGADFFRLANFPEVHGSWQLVAV